jgi:hypothetical protein
MHELPFADAIRPAAVSVLKLPMLRYAVGHELTLLYRRNPLVTLDDAEFSKLPPDEKRTAIIVAADVCCQTWAEYHALPTKSEREAIDAKWKEWSAAISTADYALAIADWRNYRAAGSQSFPQEEMPNTGAEFRYFGQPELASVFNFLQITCRLTEVEALDYPLGLARMRRQAYLESEGAIRITNHIDAEIARRKEKYEAEHPESQFELNPKE